MLNHKSNNPQRIATIRKYKENQELGSAPRYWKEQDNSRVQAFAEGYDAGVEASSSAVRAGVAKELREILNATAYGYVNERLSSQIRKTYEFIERIEKETR